MRPLTAVSLDELFGEVTPAAAKKRGPAPKLQRHMKRISRLPKPQQRFVIRTIEIFRAWPL